MELVDENPDSADTMRYVSELLLSSPPEYQNGYVVLVGDGKTYEHLMEVKRLYGQSLEWKSCLYFQETGIPSKIFSQC